MKIIKSLNIKDLREYFIYENVLKTIVGIVTGIFIFYFNAFAGLMIAEMIYETIVSSYDNIIIKFVIIIPVGLVLGYFLLNLILKIITRLFKTDGMENYSKIRLILLLSIFFYLIVLAFYFLLNLLNLSF